MASVSLAAQPRPSTGKGAARKDRAAGRLPAVVYSSGDTATHVTVDPEVLELAFSKTQDPNTLVRLEMDGGGTRTCLVRDAQRHPVSRKLLHLDFYEVDEAAEVTVPVRIKTKGVSMGVKLGGMMQVLRRSIDVRALPAAIPASVDIDVSELIVGDTVLASQITVGDGVELVFAHDFNVLRIVGKKLLEEDEEGEDGEEGEGAEGEEGESSEDGEG